MSGRVWRHRPMGRNDFEIESSLPDGRDRRVEATLVNILPPLVSLKVRRAVQAMAHAVGDTVDGTVVALAGTDLTDWQALGWDDAAQHARFMADLEQVRDQWRSLDDEVERRLLGYVQREKESADIPSKGPFTVDQLVELHSIMLRAAAVVEQDIAAEGTAA